MKNLIVAVLLAFTLPSFAQTQTDKKADEILKALTKKYKAFTSVQADFSLVMTHPEQKTNETHKGSILSKGAKYKLNINNQDIICDGKTVWTYLKESNEVQVNDLNTKEDAITPSNIFTMYEKGFVYKFVEEKAEVGKTYQFIDLMPVDKNKKFFKARLKIDKADKLLVSTIINNKDGSKATYSISKFTPNVVIADDQFSFNTAKYPKVEVVDLR